MKTGETLRSVEDLICININIPTHIFILRQTLIFLHNDHLKSNTYSHRIPTSYPCYSRMLWRTITADPHVHQWYSPSIPSSGRGTGRRRVLRQLCLHSPQELSTKNHNNFLTSFFFKQKTQMSDLRHRVFFPHTSSLMWLKQGQEQSPNDMMQLSARGTTAAKH